MRFRFLHLRKIRDIDIHYPAYVLNLRGSDIPFNPLFHSYLFVGLERAVLFVDTGKVSDEVGDYLKGLNVEVKEYNDLWAFLRRREWGEGKVIRFLVVFCIISSSCVPDPHLTSDVVRDFSHAHAFPVHCFAFGHRRDDGGQERDGA